MGWVGLGLGWVGLNGLSNRRQISWPEPVPVRRDQKQRRPKFAHQAAVRSPLPPRLYSSALEQLKTRRRYPHLWRTDYVSAPDFQESY